MSLWNNTLGKHGPVYVTGQQPQTTIEIASYASHIALQTLRTTLIPLRYCHIRYIDLVCTAECLNATIYIHQLLFDLNRAQSHAVLKQLLSR